MRLLTALSKWIWFPLWVVSTIMLVIMISKDAQMNGPNVAPMSVGSTDFTIQMPDLTWVISDAAPASGYAIVVISGSLRMSPPDGATYFAVEYETRQAELGRDAKTAKVFLKPADVAMLQQFAKLDGERVRAIAKYRQDDRYLEVITIAKDAAVKK